MLSLLIPQFAIPQIIHHISTCTPLIAINIKALSGLLILIPKSLNSPIPQSYPSFVSLWLNYYELFIQYKLKMKQGFFHIFFDLAVHTLENLMGSALKENAQ